MSIPLEQLYQFVNQCAQESWGDRVIIYRFYPHGSKDLKNLNFLDDYQHDQDLLLCPQLYCNDQEPLDFARYEQETFHSAKLLEMFTQSGMSKMNLRDYSENIWDKALLLHSEQRSNNLALYEQSAFIPVYYWSHAIIAKDWFRYAEHVQQRKKINKTFLIYNRGWAGTREYRLHFAELILRLGLETKCQMKISPMEPELGIHYDQHKFTNPVWRPQHVLENYFPVNSAHSHYSANFEITDYEATEIEIVLETLFDDDRLHLTEKSLRPIACGQPFILAGTVGSLEYLRSYGFQTYSDIWPETYDHITDSYERMVEITALMKQIANWDQDTRDKKLARAAEIAEYNRQHFFSNNFFNLVVNELETNLSQAFLKLQEQNTSQHWFDNIVPYTWKHFLQFPGSILGRLTVDSYEEIRKKVLDLRSKHST